MLAPLLPLINSPHPVGAPGCMRPNSYGWGHSGIGSKASLRWKMSEGTISLSLEQLDEPGARMRGLAGWRVLVYKLLCC